VLREARRRSSPVWRALWGDGTIPANRGRLSEGLVVRSAFKHGLLGSIST
jgi:hypothetical protein